MRTVSEVSEGLNYKKFLYLAEKDRHIFRLEEIMPESFLFISLTEHDFALGKNDFSTPAYADPFNSIQEALIAIDSIATVYEFSERREYIEFLLEKFQKYLDCYKGIWAE